MAPWGGRAPHGLETVGAGDFEGELGIPRCICPDDSAACRERYRLDDAREADLACERRNLRLVADEAELGLRQARCRKRVTHRRLVACRRDCLWWIVGKAQTLRRQRRDENARLIDRNDRIERRALRQLDNGLSGLLGAAQVDAKSAVSERAS